MLISTQELISHLDVSEYKRGLLGLGVGMRSSDCHSIINTNVWSLWTSTESVSTNCYNHDR